MGNPSMGGSKRRLSSRGLGGALRQQRARLYIIRRFVIYVKDEAGDDQLWLALHPALETKPEFYDSLLNGVEVFKLNDTDLSGPNPRPSEMLPLGIVKIRTIEKGSGL
ncbi:hypothetical protein JHK84_034670 [Glycine max]|nr:hypothetical protein JHK84_034670 [Glycine max]